VNPALEAMLRSIDSEEWVSREQRIRHCRKMAAEAKALAATAAGTMRDEYLSVGRMWGGTPQGDSG